jgi:hypothetical protein
MPLSKRTRFEVFKRDGFSCQYCGRRPPDVVLEVDHVHPRAAGGTDDDLNLTTSCEDCNRGKSARLLLDIRPRPDADLAYLETQQEFAEAHRYLHAKKQLAEIVVDLGAALKDVWADHFDGVRCLDDAAFRRWLASYSPSEIEDAFRAAGVRVRSRKVSRYADDIVKYVSAILKNRREEGTPQ